MNMNPHKKLIRKITLNTFQVKGFVVILAVFTCFERHSMHAFILIFVSVDKAIEETAMFLLTITCSVRHTLNLSIVRLTCSCVTLCEILCNLQLLSHSFPIILFPIGK